jgi:hypothetical protein
VHPQSSADEQSSATICEQLRSVRWNTFMPRLLQMRVLLRS